VAKAAEPGTRTRTGLPPTVFETAASTIPPARRGRTECHAASRRRQEQVKLPEIDSVDGDWLLKLKLPERSPDAMVSTASPPLVNQELLP
jgi:hypothetical protein